jgi:ABC-type branched-subunit amino acid transport system ATPase component
MQTTTPSLTNTPPSRETNPFATCWTRPGAIPFHFQTGETASSLIAKLAAHNWRATIIGPHGSGKTTLLESLKPTLIAAGRSVHTVSLQNGQRRLPPLPSHQGSNFLLVIDGYEQLSRLERIEILSWSYLTRIGLLVTSHARTFLPTLIRLAPNLALVEELVADLSAKVSTTITPADVAASHACHGSNVREILFDLYDRHEQQRRASLT